MDRILSVTVGFASSPQSSGRRYSKLDKIRPIHD